MPGGTPYITAAMLQSAPAGLAWNVVPTLTASTADQQAQLAQVCWHATSFVDTYCRQPLRATAATDSGTGPGQPRIACDRVTGQGTLITRRWPVTAVSAIQVSVASTFPPSWTLVPASQYLIRHPVLMPAAPVPVEGPSGGNAVDVAAGNITWDYGRAGWRVMISYTAGWPHAGLAASAAQNATTVSVDDVTGWAGQTGFMYDGQATEAVTVNTAAAAAPVQLPGAAGTVQAGPGTLTLSAPLASAHAAGTVISALPGTVIRAAALAGAVEALETIDAIATQSLSGQMAGGTGVLAQQCELALDDFRRVA